MPKAKIDGISLETGMLSFARSIQPSEGLFWGTHSHAPDRREPIAVIEKGVRGQSSEAKTDNPGKSNPQVVEAAWVPPGCDGVELSFSMWVSPFVRKPWACGDAAVGQAYEKLVTDYAEKGGFDVLARLYLWNIANGRFAWRNRFQADAMEVRVTVGEDTGGKDEVVFDPTRLQLGTPATADDLSAAVIRGEPTRAYALIALIAKGLRDERSFMKVAWRAGMEEGQEVFPSQEYLRDEKKKDAPSRVYAKLPREYAGRTVNQASMHSQKIGAALRHIDIWHGDDMKIPIAVNPYGGVQETGDVLRRPDTKKSFYALRSKADVLMAGIEEATSADDLPGDVHFVIANLVRGGVYGQKGGN